VIFPAIRNGSVVIADRFTDSWLAYQSKRYPERIKLVDVRRLDIYEAYNKILKIVNSYLKNQRDASTQ